MKILNFCPAAIVTGRGSLAYLKELEGRRVLVVCGHIVTEEMKNDIAIAQRLGITATTLEGILTVKGQGKRRRG